MSSHACSAALSEIRAFRKSIGRVCTTPLPLAPLILGLILGDQIEINLVRALMTDANLWLFLTRPISGAMLLLSVASVLIALWQHRRAQKRVMRADVPDVDF